MSSRLFERKFRPIWMVCAFCVAAAGLSRAADPSSGRRPIQFTAPKHDNVGTNVNELRGSQSGLKSLEDDLARPLQSFSLNPDSSLGGAAMRPLPPPRNTINSRLRVPRDPRRDWAFSTPEEIMGGPSADDIFNATEPGGSRDPERQTTMERYFTRLFGPPTNRPGPFNPQRSGNNDWDDRSSETNGMSGGDEMDRSLRNLLESGPRAAVFAPPAVPTAFGDLFRFNVDHTPTPETLRVEREQQARIESFKKMWEPAIPARPPTPMPDAGPAWNNLGNSFSSSQSQPASTPFGQSPSFNNSSIGGVPAVPPPVINPPPPPRAKMHEDFSVPRRPF